MGEAAVRATIYGIVNGVTDVGNVYDYDRWAGFLKQYIKIAKVTIGGADVLRFWCVTCESWEEEWITFGYGDGLVRQYTYKVHAAFGYDDANESEKTAIGIVEDVIEALDASAALHDGNTYLRSMAAQLTIFEARIIGEHLVHYAEITQQVQEVQ